MATDIDGGLCQTVVTQFLGVQRHTDGARLTGEEFLWYDLRTEIGRQVHHRGCHRIGAVVHDMDLLNGCIAFVHIVELEFILIEQEVFYLIGIVAGIILQFCHDNAFHREIDGLIGTVALDGGHLVETTELTGIVGQFDGELIPCPDLLGELDIGTAAIGFHAFDQQAAMTFVLQFEGGGDRLLKACSTALQDGFDYRQFLCCGSEK